MARDVFVYFKKGKKPTQAEAEKVITQFFGEAAKQVAWDGDRFQVTLVGKWAHPMRDVIPLHPGQLEAGQAPYDYRALEVYLAEDNLDVITRHADQFTNACATGLAQVFACYWEGELQDG